VKILVKAIIENEPYHLDLTLVAGKAGLQRPITHTRVQKPGIALAGFRESVRSDRVQIFGKTEIAYLNHLDEPARRASIQALFDLQLGCVIVTCGLALPESLQEIAEDSGVALFVTPHETSVFINRLNGFLDEHLSPEEGHHAVLLDVFGVGVMLTGHSGIGKSECALDLVLRGHRLVSDDMVIAKQMGHTLVGSGTSITRHLMEVRGLGIINVRELFGAASVCESKEIELIVDLIDWRPDLEFDRLGLDENTLQILETEVPRVQIPIRPGRNIASIVEVAARNHLLKLQGLNAATEFQKSLDLRLAELSRGGGDQ